MADPIKAKAFDLEELKKLNGYQSRWASRQIEVGLHQILNAEQKTKLPKVDGRADGILHYSNLSILYNQKRKLPFLAAYNIAAGNKETKRTSFQTDPRILDTIQLNDDFYKIIKGSDQDFEIGHMAANDEMAWGDEAQLQSYRTFFFPNSCPQVERLNAGLWRTLEQYFIKEAVEITNKNAHIFTGPVLNPTDPPYVYEPSIQLPLYFFKMVVFEYRGSLHSTGFIMSQEKRLKELKIIPTRKRTEMKMLEEQESPFMDYKHEDLFQVDIELIEDLSKLNLKWNQIKRIKIPGSIEKLEVISKVGSAGDTRGLTGNKSLNEKLSSTSQPTFQVQNFRWE